MLLNAFLLTFGGLLASLLVGPVGLVAFAVGMLLFVAVLAAPFVKG